MSTPRGKITLSNILKAGVATVVFFALLESLIRIAYHVRNSYVDVTLLPYAMQDEYGPVPPWIKQNSMFKGDYSLLWTGTPNFHRRYIDDFSPVRKNSDRYALIRKFFPAIPDSLRDRPVWEISLNSEGFRDDEFPDEKAPSEFRIVCLGDSWTVGSNVNQNESYPYLLEESLKKEFPRANFKTFNLGVFGYTSYQGLRLVKRAIELKPDIFIVGFAMNESDILRSIDQLGENTNYDHTKRRRKKTVLSDVKYYISENFELYKLLRYWALILKWKPSTMDKYLRDTITLAQYSHGLKERQNSDPWFKDTLRQSRQNFRGILDTANKNNVDTIFLYPEFLVEGPILKVLEDLSDEEKVPIVDASRLIADEQRKIQDNLEEQLGLIPETQKTKDAAYKAEVEVIFRVYVDDYPVPNAVYITGNHNKLGDLIPNKIKMYDDGTHGDQRAGDGVWSYSATFPPRSEIFYVYTNSGKEGKWEGLDIPDIRYLKIGNEDNDEVLYAPIDTFGKMYMKADPNHTNPDGNKLIAKAVLEKVKESKNFKSYIAQLPTNSY
jgi:lysophospholipase L1-like esterase